MTVDEKIVRHPLAFLLKAADDIANRGADFEDGFKKGLIPLETIRKIYDTLIKEAFHSKMLLKDMSFADKPKYEQEINVDY